MIDKIKVSDELITNMKTIVSNEIENKDLVELHNDVMNNIDNNINKDNENTKPDTNIYLTDDNYLINEILTAISDIEKNLTSGDFVIKSMIKTVYTFINQYNQYTKYILEAETLMRELVDEQAVVKQETNIIQLLNERKKILNDIVEVMTNIQKLLNDKQKIELQKLKLNQVDEDIINNLLTG